MKLIAVLLNITLLCVAGTLILNNLPTEGRRIALDVIFIAAPVSTLMWAYVSRGNSWLGLYWRRRALEEQARIDALTKPRA